MRIQLRAVLREHLDKGAAIDRRYETPMIAQILGAVTNIVLDPLFDFRPFRPSGNGIAGAAVATVAGQIVAALVVMRKGFRRSPAAMAYPHHVAKIFRLGIPNILMQSAYTFYIFGLNLILASFCDEAVTALGIYYKWQTFFLSRSARCRRASFRSSATITPRETSTAAKRRSTASVLFGAALMAVGTLIFVSLPLQMLLRTFTSDALVIEIGTVGFRIIGLGFIPMVTSLIFPVFFQAVGSSLKSSALTVIRTVVLFVPLGYLFLPLRAEPVLADVSGYGNPDEHRGVYILPAVPQKDYVSEPKPLRADDGDAVALKPSKPGVIITIAREHGSSGKQIGKLVAQKLGIPFYYKGDGGAGRA